MIMHVPTLVTLDSKRDELAYGHSLGHSRNIITGH